jgi:hypothetical protein
LCKREFGEPNSELGNTVLSEFTAIEALERQEPFVNQTLAYHALAMLARLFRYGRLSYHGGFINLRNGRATSLAVNPALWRRMLKHT